MINLTNQFSNHLIGNLDEFVNQALRNLGPAPAAKAPGAYRYEDDSAYRLRLEIPGFSKEQLSLDLADHELTVKAENPKTEASYERTLTLPDVIEEDNISAKLEHGILELTFPKAKVEKPATHSIEIS